MVFPPAELSVSSALINTGSEPARYVATGVGSVRYPFTAAQRRSSIGAKPGETGADWTSRRHGGDQIDYEDQDPRIHKMWLDELRRNGVEPRMQNWRPA